MAKATERCRATGKRRYRDHDEAVQGVRRIQSRSQRERIPVRVYECSACHGWHSTSQKVWGQHA